MVKNMEARPSGEAPKDGPIAVPEGPPRPLDRLLRDHLGCSWGRARGLVAAGKVTVDGAPERRPERLVRSGTEVVLRIAAPRPRGGLPDDAIVFFDTHVVVVNKPAGVSTVPYDEGERGTLDELVRTWLGRRRTKAGGPRRGPAPLGVVHRIDKETSGLVVFTRTWLAKESLAAQFRAHTVERRYLAIAHGTVRSQTIRSYLVADRGDGLRGSSRHAGQGQRAVTHVDALEVLGGGRASLVACRLETGRTHQIRIHLSEAGHPLVGERVYVRGFVGLALGAPRLMLHAETLGFAHPATGARVRWHEEPPQDFSSTLERLRRG
jgi:23S rRNA pseudouridine1911/1915/1917 synthase